MDYYSSQINKLVEQLSNLPGIGAKSAQRLAFHILNMPLENVKELSASILEAKENVRYCKECFTLTDQEVCPICSNPKRNKQQIMVVENTEIWQLMKKPENTREFIMSCMEQFLQCLE